MQAQQDRAGTPSSLPPVASEAVLATLDFPAAVDVVAGWASGPLGAAHVRARRPGADPTVIQADLALLVEGLELFDRGTGLDVPPVPDIAGPLHRLRIEGSVLDGSELLPVLTTIKAARVLAHELRQVRELAPRLAALESPVPDPGVERTLERSLDEHGGLLDTASPGLLTARRDVQTARDHLVARLEAILRSLDPQAAGQGSGVTLRAGRYVIPVRRDSRGRPEGIVHDESASAGTLFIEPTATIGLGNALREAVAAESREVLRVYRALTDLLRPRRDVLAAAHTMCVLADDALARIRYARSVNASVPAIRPPGEPLVLRTARHPLLLSRGDETVPFDLVLEADERTLLVSGPNAGGKTVLLKTVGLAAAMVQSGMTPPLGTGSALPVFTRMLVDIGDHQSIAASLSTFSAHAAFLRTALEQADRATLVLLDELGSGTDPAEGAALGWATLESLTERGVMTLATTHLGALKTFASGIARLAHGSLAFDGATLSPTYRFSKGLPGRSFGLAIARRLGVDSVVVSRAEQQVPHGERALDTLLEDVQERDRRLRLQETELAELRDRTERQAIALAAREGEIAAREAELRTQERDRDRRARQQAKAFLLDARRTVEDALARAAAARTGEDARQARRIVEAALQAAVPGDVAVRPEAGLPLMGDLRQGLRVRMEAGNVAQVEEVRSDGKVVVRAGSVRLVIAREAVREVLPDGAARPAARGFPDPLPSTETSASLDIDLRGLRVHEAEDAVVAAVDQAVLGDQPFLRIIHGKGTGAVRERVHEVLRTDRRVSRFALAPANQGGSGVTIVEFGA